MQLQIWKPENQRPGRHFVYSSRYIKFFTRLLDQLSDRNGLEGLARRVRKRQADIFEHGTVWQDICHAYLRVLRDHGSVPMGHETAIFSGISHDDFLRRKDGLEQWCQDASSSSPVLTTLQEALELKKINANLMKAGTIDDLIGDAYAFLYDTIGRRLWTAAEAQEETQAAADKERQHEAELKVKTVTAPSPGRNPMMNLSHLMNVDGATDNTAPPTAQTSALPTPTAERSTPVPGAVAAAGQETAAAPAPRRKIGVGRKEIRLSAEALVAKSTPATTTTVGGSAAAGNAPSGSGGMEVSYAKPDPTKQVQVVIERSKPGATTTSAKTSTGNGKSTTTDISQLGGPGASDADDDESEESDLSDVDEEVVTQGTTGNFASIGAKPAPRPKGAEPKSRKQPAPKSMVGRALGMLFPGLGKGKAASERADSSDLDEVQSQEYHNAHEQQEQHEPQDEMEEEEEEEEEGDEGEEGDREDDGGEEEDEEGEEEHDGDDDEGEGEDITMGDADHDINSADEEEEDNERRDSDNGREIMGTSAAWHNQQARLAAAAADRQSARGGESREESEEELNDSG